MAEDFHGVGLKFPFSLEERKVALTKEQESIEESIMIILGTAKGERLMRPDFGCGLQEMLFSPLNSSTASLAVFYIEEALKKWEPRIELVKVDVITNTSEENRMDVLIDYTVITSNTRYNLVYPFYLERGEKI